MMSGITTKSKDRQWFIVGRWQDFEGEARANLVRIVAIGGFYVVQLLHYYMFTSAENRDVEFHRAVTWLAVTWALVALAIHLCIYRRKLPAALKYVSTGCDIVLLTAVSSLGANKAESPMVLAYFVIIALAGLRFRLRLIWCATLGSMLGYVSLVGMADETWFDEDHAVAPVQQLVTLLSLGLTGIVLGQIVRRVRWLAEHYAERISSAQESE